MFCTYCLITYTIGDRQLYAEKNEYNNHWVGVNNRQIEYTDNKRICISGVSPASPIDNASKLFGVF